MKRENAFNLMADDEIDFPKRQLPVSQITEIKVNLATLYGVTTKRLNEQVKRNMQRFPSDFMFRLSKQEKDEVVANCDHLQNLKYSRTTPHAFTEHGAIMAAGVLNTKRAVEVSILVVRAFVEMGKMISDHEGSSKEA